MASTTVIWTALPAGVTSGQLRISLLVSPRLDPGADPAVLASFPVLADWPAVVSQAEYAVRFGDGSTVQAARTDPPDGLDPVMWAALFRPELPVRPYLPVDRTGNAVFSYPVQTLHEQLRQCYGRVGVLSPFGTPSQRMLENLIGRPDRGSGGYADLLVDENSEAAAREDMRQHPQVPVRSADGPAARFWAFHHQPVPETWLDLDGADAPDLANYIDFHQAVTALRSYPALLRALGLVVDLTLPLEALPPGAGTLTVDVHGDIEGLSSLAMWTAYARTATSFTAAADPAAGAARDLVDNGYVVLDPQVFGAVQIDVEGAVFKAQQLMTSLLSAAGRPRDEAALPALRSAGISLVRTGRADVLAALFGRAAALESALPALGTVFVEDLIRGYRLDLWDDRTDAWHSLLGRDGAYTTTTAGGDPLTRRFVDEAAIEPAVTSTAIKPGSAPPPDADLYLHEALARWDGWSLAAPRPGRPVNRSADPMLATSDDPTAGQPLTAVPLSTSFRPSLTPLPQLRFGRRYRLRLRAVDLAGNSLPVGDAGESRVLPTVGALPYLRFEPIPAPTVIHRVPLPLASTGETVDRIVLRTANTDPALDGVVTAAPVDRHLAPPRTSVQGAEVHGSLDDTDTGRLRGDAATFAELSSRDGAQLAGGDAPVAPEDQLVTPWLPDPLARGVALRDLPGVPPSSESVAGADGPLTPAPLPRTFIERAVEPSLPVERVVRVPFDGAAWPAIPAFRLVCVDAGAGDPPVPVWDGGSRTLTVALLKATTTTVPISSYVSESDLPVLGVWGWIREALQRLSEEVSVRPDAAAELEIVGIDAQLLLQLARTGGHWMLTPARVLTLVHAVQQPIGCPELESLSAWRIADDSAARLTGRLRVHGASTVQVDLVASWSDRVEDPDSATGYRDVPVEGHVDQFRIEDASTAGQVFAGGNPPRAVGYYDPVADTVAFENANPVHHFGDTRHRFVRYRAVSTSRFREHFAPDAVVTRTSAEVTVSVPSSARPPAPDVSYVMPTFGWQRSTDDIALRSSIRHGGGLRVYLNPPRSSSGVGELLGVVLWPSGIDMPADYLTRRQLSPFVTGWGADPVWPGGSVRGNPARGDFLEAVAAESGVSLPELANAGGPFGVDVVGHALSYDADRRLWYTDVVLASDAYFPFIRLALARWQPDSVSGQALSRVVLADVTQLTPDRSVLATADPWSPGTVRVTVSGNGYRLAEAFAVRPQTAVVSVEVQTRTDAADDDILGWEAADPNHASVVPDPIEGVGNNLLWRGTVGVPADRLPGTYRLLITETETWFGDPNPRLIVNRPTLVPRIVYAEHLPL